MYVVRSIQNAEHYTWGEKCDGWHLAKTDGLSVIQENMPPGTAEQMHFHLQAQQLFYILSGIATFEVEGQRLLAKANETLHIPAGTRHCIINESENDLAFLVISSPKSHGDRENV